MLFSRAANELTVKELPYIDTTYANLYKNNNTLVLITYSSSSFNKRNTEMQECFKDVKDIPIPNVRVTSGWKIS